MVLSLTRSAHRPQARSEVHTHHPAPHHQQACCRRRSWISPSIMDVYGQVCERSVVPGKQCLDRLMHLPARSRVYVCTFLLLSRTGGGNICMRDSIKTKKGRQHFSGWTMQPDQGGHIGTLATNALVRRLTKQTVSCHDWVLHETTFGKCYGALSMCRDIFASSIIARRLVRFCTCILYCIAIAITFSPSGFLCNSHVGVLTRVMNCR